MSLCRACGLDHSPRENCGIARRKAAYLETQANAILKPVAEDIAPLATIPLPTKEQKQGWARDAYNAYMRDYMKKKRDAKQRPDCQITRPAP